MLDPATEALIGAIIQTLIQTVQTAMAQKSAAHQAVLDNLVAASDALSAARADAQKARAEGQALRDLLSKGEPTT